jgi:hypothetical protein
MPQLSWWKRENYRSGKKMPDGFHYSSWENDTWMGVEDLKGIVNDTGTESSVESN